MGMNATIIIMYTVVVFHEILKPPHKWIHMNRVPNISISNNWNPITNDSKVYPQNTTFIFFHLGNW